MNIIDFTTKQFDTLYLRLTPRKFYPLLLFILILIGLTPLLLPGLPNPDYQDLYYHLSRLHTMDVNFSLGEIPSMINHEAKNGYGYGTGLFYPDLFLYLPVLAMKCGVSIIAAYKLFIIISVYAAAISAYYCALKISHDHFCAFTTSIFHTWSSYSAICILFRAAIGEYSTFIFMPWILLGLYEIIIGNPCKGTKTSFISCLVPDSRCAYQRSIHSPNARAIAPFQLPSRGRPRRMYQRTLYAVCKTFS